MNMKPDGSNWVKIKGTKLKLAQSDNPLNADHKW